MSPDPRYSKDCYGFLLKEAEILSLGKRPRWVPKAHQRLLQGKITGEKQYPIPKHLAKQKEVLLHTKSEESHAYQNPTRDVVFNFGGRPKKDVPVEVIHRLSKEGLSIGNIVKELKVQGQIISAMTVSRVLAGERN